MTGESINRTRQLRLSSVEEKKKLIPLTEGVSENENLVMKKNEK